MKHGILLSNLGSPAAPTAEALKPYLDQFLMDPYVIDIPYIFRALIVRGIILRVRPKKSAAAYKIIWQKGGSPLLIYTRAITKKLQHILGDAYSVKFAMRYGTPSFSSVLAEFASEGVQDIDLLPLYPQWALASVASTLAHVRELKTTAVKRVLKPFYKDKAFIQLWVDRYKKLNLTPETSPRTHFIFSFHGVPNRHIRKTPGCAQCALTAECCRAENAPELCYRSHCQKTADAIARGIGLQEADYTITFQSRLEPDKWLQPFTDRVLPELPKRGVERLVLFSPAFTADCLETIEELGERARHDFLSARGKEFHLVPSLNDGDDWAAVLANWVQDANYFTEWTKAIAPLGV